MSQAFVPLIEGRYSCAGADNARNMAHSLHMAIGQAKDVISNPRTPKPTSSNSDEPPDTSPLGTGVADELAYMERKLASLVPELVPVGMHKEEGLGIEVASMPDPMCFFMGFHLSSQSSRCADRNQGMLDKRREQQRHPYANAVQLRRQVVGARSRAINLHGLPMVSAP